MRTLKEIINESLTGAEAILQSIKTKSLNRDQRISILIQNDAQTLRKISDELKRKYKNDYFPFEPTQDDFLKNKEKVCAQIVDAIINLEK